MMTPRFDLVLKGGTCATPNGIESADIGIHEGRIAAIGTVDGAAGASVIDATHLHVLPGIIDPQVHLREPGLDHQDDLAAGTTAAVLGGVTAVLEMPDTNPPTLSGADLADKCRRAKDRARCDIAFFVSASADNGEHLAELERLPGSAGIAAIMGGSSGAPMVADDATLSRVLASGHRRVCVHCEDEERLADRFALVRDGASVSHHAQWRDVETALSATKRLLAAARGVKRRVHVLNVTTAEEMALLAQRRDIATIGVTPQHLSLKAPEAYERLGSRAQNDPPIRDARHRDALWQALRAGLVDCIGSDHAPHTLEEKARPYPRCPSGMPGVQTLVPVMLDHVNTGRLSLERFVDLCSAGPARVFSIANKGRIALGYDADFTIVDLKARRTITDSWIASRCGWTPFDGTTVTGWPMTTIVRGHVAMHEGEVLGEPIGTAVRFLESL